MFYSFFLSIFIVYVHCLTDNSLKVYSQKTSSVLLCLVNFLCKLRRHLRQTLIKVVFWHMFWQRWSETKSASRSIKLVKTCNRSDSVSGKRKRRFFCLSNLGNWKEALFASIRLASPAASEKIPVNLNFSRRNFLDRNCEAWKPE